MASLEQLRALEERIEKAIGLISSLKRENAALHVRLESLAGEFQKLELQNKEYETRIEGFHTEQGRIEAGIMHALDKLNAFEDLMAETVRVAPAPVVPTRAAPPKKEEPAPVAPASKPAAEADTELSTEEIAALGGEPDETVQKLAETPLAQHLQHPTKEKANAEPHASDDLF